MNSESSVLVLSVLWTRISKVWRKKLHIQSENPVLINTSSWVDNLIDNYNPCLLSPLQSKDLLTFQFSALTIQINGFLIKQSRFIKSTIQTLFLCTLCVLNMYCKSVKTLVIWKQIQEAQFWQLVIVLSQREGVSVVLKELLLASSVLKFWKLSILLSLANFYLDIIGLLTR